MRGDDGSTISSLLNWVIGPLTTRLVEVLTSVTELVRIDENAKGGATWMD
jgi:hypothetical protein